MVLKTLSDFCRYTTFKIHQFEILINPIMLEFWLLTYKSFSKLNNVVLFSVWNSNEQHINVQKETSTVGDMPDFWLCLSCLIHCMCFIFQKTQHKTYPFRTLNLAFWNVYFLFNLIELQQGFNLQSFFIQGHGRSVLILNVVKVLNMKLICLFFVNA